MAYVHGDFREEDSVFEGFAASPPEERLEDIITEAAEGGQIADFAEKQLRAVGMSVALAWVADEDYSFDYFDALVVGVADLDLDEEISEDEAPYYNDLLSATAEALVFLGGAPENVQNFIDSEDAKEGTKLGTYLKEKLDGESRDDEELIASFAVRESLIAESTVRVVRNGEVVLARKRVGRKRRMTSAQKIALQKARRKAHSGMAKLARRKSLALRRKRGL